MKNYAMTLLVFTCVFFLLLFGAGSMSEKADKEGMKILEDAIRRASVQCYAIEGVYPPSVGYLEEHYGIRIDEKKYTVGYSGFASNMMPDITVIQKETER